MPQKSIFYRTLKNAKHPVQNLKWLSYQRSKKEDIILSTMQFSGTHWLRFILAKALVDYFELPYEFKDIRAQEITPTFRDPKQHFIYNSREEIPRIQQGHLPYHFPYSLFLRNKKVIFLTRDLRDALISQYEKMKKIQVPFSLFLRDLEGKYNNAFYGTLKERVEFLNSWHKNKKKVKDFVTIKYEDLQKDPERELSKILIFIGLKNFDDNFLREVIDFASMDNMKRIHFNSIEKKSFPLYGKPPAKNTINKGKMGNYKNYFSEEDLEFFNNYIKENLLYDFRYNYLKSK